MKQSPCFKSQDNTFVMFTQHIICVDFFFLFLFFWSLCKGHKCIFLLAVYLIQCKTGAAIFYGLPHKVPKELGKPHSRQFGMYFQNHTCQELKTWLDVYNVRRVQQLKILLDPQPLKPFFFMTSKMKSVEDVDVLDVTFSLLC